MIYTDDNRGAIQFRERRKQLVDYSGLRIGNITPTDCDGLIEYRDKAYVLFEIKHRNAKVPSGQLKALVRSVDDFKQAHKAAILIIAEHDVDNPALDIDAAKCAVRVFYDGAWKKSDETLADLIQRFISYVDRRHHEQNIFIGQPYPRRGT